ncbi:hypothetical protein [Bordetella genomosp. 12]|uniref:hypothetical protein n=1 Tax=Bordetella genomosp. 12 TaxID=463035 RepID=UPI00142D21F3|nr:hypothetical protein [Bordetella genomosp. 12]
MRRQVGNDIGAADSNTKSGIWIYGYSSDIRKKHTTIVVGEARNVKSPGPKKR